MESTKQNEKEISEISKRFLKIAEDVGLSGYKLIIENIIPAGHKDIKTTQIYAKILKTTIERNVLEKML